MRHRHIGTCVILAVRLVLLLSLSFAALAAPPVAAGETGDDAPLDLAALVLHSDDLIWLFEEMGLLVDDGYPYGMTRLSRCSCGSRQQNGPTDVGQR